MARDLGIARKGINAGRTGSRAIFREEQARQSTLERQVHPRKASAALA
jgi:hypothetical protein